MPNNNEKHCNCSPMGSPSHDHDSHTDEHNGPGVTGWTNPKTDEKTGPGATGWTNPDANSGPGVKK